MLTSRNPLAVGAVAVVSSLFLLFFFVQPTFATNTIAGTVFDKVGTPLSDIDVELLDQFYRLTPNGRQKTSASGRFEFNVETNADYTIRVYAFRYDLVDESRTITVGGISSIPGQSGSSFTNEDFYLQPKKGSLRYSEIGVIFAQDVPKAAEKEYKNALDLIKHNKTDEAFVSLQKALEIFPDYYYALQRYGDQLFFKKQYTAAVKIYMRAAEINPKSGMSYYNAAYALSLLDPKYTKNALVAVEEAYRLAPLSTEVLLLYGRLERKAGKLTDAEKHLLLAKRNSTEKNPDLQLELVQLYANDLKKFKEAADELEIYIKAANLSKEDEKKFKDKLVDLRSRAQKST